jgi:hypothetical protein
LKRIFSAVWIFRQVCLEKVPKRVKHYKKGQKSSGIKGASYVEYEWLYALIKILINSAW